jgi:type I restriction enzyme S subunit
MSATLKLEQQEGNIPPGWELVAIDEVCTLGGGKTPRKGNDEYWQGNIPWVSPKDFDGVTLDETEDSLTQNGASENSINLYEAGDIAIVVRSGVLRHSLPVAQLKSDMAVNQDIKVLQPDTTKITSDYLLNILQYEADRIRASCVKTGTTVESVETAFLKAYKLPLPPLPEQRRIAEILSIIDKQIRQTDNAVKKTKELRRGLMQELLRRGIDHEEFQKRRLGLSEVSIPESWSVQNAGSLFNIEKTGYDPSEHTGEVYLYSMPAFDEGKEPIVTPTEEIGSKKRIVPEDTILFPKLNIRKKRFWRVRHNHNLPAICSTEYWPLTATENAYLDFYTFYFQSYHFMSDPKVSSSSSTNSHKRVTQSSFEKVQLPVPPIEEQKKIAEILNTTSEKIGQEYNKKEHLQELKRGLMQDLLTGKVRVNAD